MSIKLPGGVSRDGKYLSPLLDRQQLLGMFPWTEHLNVAVRGHSFATAKSSQQGRRDVEVGGKENGKQMGLMVNFNQDSLLALSPLEKRRKKRNP